MNRFPVWKYALIGIVILLAFVYTVPNFFGESPAVQVTSAKSTVKVDTALMSRVEDVLKKANTPYTGAQLDATGVRVRLADTDTQIRAKDILERGLNTDSSDPAYVVALNLLPASPRWLTAINALPMYLGLDLRGGVHFLLQIDMQAAITKRIENLAADVRGQLREKNVRHGGVTREAQTIRVRFRDAATRDAARAAISANIPDLALSERDDGQDLLLVATLRPEVHKRVQESAVQQNIGTLHKRVNELGVAEPVIQQQGADRIVVQLPGVQDIAAREGDPRPHRDAGGAPGRRAGACASGSTFGIDVFPERRRDGTVGQVPTKRQVIVTGDQFIGAQATFDQDNRPAVAVELDQAGGRAMRHGHAREPEAPDGHHPVREGQGRGDLGGHHPGRVRQPLPDHRLLHAGRDQQPRAPDPRRRARRADGDHRGAHHRPEPRARQHREGLPRHAVGLHRHRGLHVAVLPRSSASSRRSRSA